MARIIALSLLSLIIPSVAFSLPVVFCKDGPGINLVTDGCVSGDANAYPGGGDMLYDNAAGGDSEAKVEESILLATGVSVNISLYGKSDSNAALFSFNPTNLTSSLSGTWTVLDGTAISYITVKASNSYALYQISPAGPSGSFSTAGIFNNGGQQPNVSHISFWTSPQRTEIPEPASMLLFGLGSAGLLGIKRRKAERA